MAEFLELIESIRAEEATIDRLFGGDGMGVRSRARSPQYLKRLADAATFMADVYDGRRPMYHLQEAMTTSDFPYLFSDILDRQLLANYQEAPYSWKAYCKRAVVRDFRQVKRKYLSGGEGTLEQVTESHEYQRAALSDGEYAYQVKKYGRQIALSWETLINDDLDAFRTLPERLGKAARRTEEKFATELFVGTTGPHASLYTSGNANIVTSNPALSVAALQTAMGILLTQTDSDGEPIMVEAMTLAVPPQLQVTAFNILNAVQIWAKTSGGGASAQEIVVGNWIKNAGIVQAVTNFYIPQVASSSNGATSWFLFADPNNGRPALELGFLRGHEDPEVFIKAPNAVRAGGGAADPLAGDFDTDSVEYKVRHVFGGARMDPKMTCASNGSGS
jgi:hypothetical protein